MNKNKKRVRTWKKENKFRFFLGLFVISLVLSGCEGDFTGSAYDPVVGCIDSGAINYDPNAVIDDGTCEYQGCIDSGAINYDPYATTGFNTANFLQSFGFGDYSPGVSFTLMPVFEDLLRIQSIEFNDMVRKSQYSFSLINNKIRLFPKPTSNYKLYFDYILTSE